MDLNLAGVSSGHGFVSSSVSSDAARRIVNILSVNGIALSSSTALLIEGGGSFDITRLNVKQLKAVAKALNSTGELVLMPRSGAKKCEWVNAVSGALTAASSQAAPTNALNNEINHVIQQCSILGGMNQSIGLSGANPFPQNVAVRQHQITLPNDTSIAGLKRPANQTAGSNNFKQPKHAPVKIKKEPQYHVTSTNRHSLSQEEDDDRPRDVRESSLVDTMRNMGFTNNREILSGIRAVAAQREEVSFVAATGWSSQDHVEAAMMWIIAQREEAEEARKEDEARFSSERSDAEMMQRRKEEREVELMSCELVDLLGSIQDDEIMISSKYFPHSVILQSEPTKQMFTMISSVNDSVKATHARKEVLRYLKLEKKATDWYGHVLPYSFFHHSAKSRFESWTKSNGHIDQIIQQLIQECNDLEKALYNLSEQEEGGVANVPKVFVQAQRDAVQKGLPTKQTRHLDDEIEILEDPSVDTKRMERQKPADVIEIL